MSQAEQENQQTTHPNANISEVSRPSHPTSFKINGLLPGGKRLTRPLDVVVAYDDEEVIVSEPHFHIHATGSTIAKAIAEFKRILVDDLTADADELGPRLQAELKYLRSLIKAA